MEAPQDKDNQITDFFKDKFGATLANVDKYMSQQSRFFNNGGQLN